jgi:ketosteroid isomerase-like protein
MKSCYMKKVFPFISLLFLPAIIIHAQQLSPSLQSLLDTEKAFSAMAEEKNTRDAFISFLSDSTITFDAKPRIGKKHLENTPQDSSLLSWKATFADVATAGDLGYTSGPWSYLKNKTDQQPLAYGHFVCIWKKEGHDWRVLCDIGINHPQCESTNQLKTSSIKAKSKKKGTSNELSDIEKSFIDQLTKEGTSTYKAALSKEGCLFHSGYPPFKANNVLANIIPQQNRIVYHYIDGAIASSNDFGFVYGTAIVHVNESDVQQANYVRVWKKENGKHWRIVADVLSIVN